MADNVQITEGAGTYIATDDLSGIQYQIVKLCDGSLNSAAAIKGSVTKGLYVDPRISSTLISATPTVTASGIYAAKDAIGGIMSFANAARTSADGGVLESVTIVDKAQQMAAMDLVLFNASPGGTFTDNSAFDPSDADLLTVVGVVPIVGADYFDFNDNSVAHRSGLGIIYHCAATTLYGALIARGTPTYAATSDVTVTVGVVPD